VLIVAGYRAVIMIYAVANKEKDSGGFGGVSVTVQVVKPFFSRDGTF
jgi:hypothetical protein